MLIYKPAWFCAVQSIRNKTRGEQMGSLQAAQHSSQEPAPPKRLATCGLHRPLVHNLPRLPHSLSGVSFDEGNLAYITTHANSSMRESTAENMLSNRYQRPADLFEKWTHVHIPVCGAAITLLIVQPLNFGQVHWKAA